MRSWIQNTKKLLPDLLPVMQTRMQILQYIRLMQPIGRRNLSASLGMTERVLRSEVQVLKRTKLSSRRFFWNDFDRRRNNFSSCFGRLYERNFRVKGFRKAT